MLLSSSVSVFGIKLEIIVIILLVIIIALIVGLVLTIRRLEYVNRKYYVIMSGKRGKDLEKVILTRFKEMDKVKANARRVTSEHKKFKGHLDSQYQCNYTTGSLNHIRKLFCKLFGKQKTDYRTKNYRAAIYKYC